MADVLVLNPKSDFWKWSLTINLQDHAQIKF